MGRIGLYSAPVWYINVLQLLVCQAYLYSYYELVRAKRPKLCQPWIPLAISTRMSHVWHHTDRQNSGSKRATFTVLLVEALGLAPTNHGPSKRSTTVKCFRKNKPFFFFFFSTPRHICEKFRANIRRSDCVRPISSHFLRPKLITHWN